MSPRCPCLLLYSAPSSMLAASSVALLGTVRDADYCCCLAAQTIGVWGDIGHTPNSTDTRNHLLTNNPVIVYNTADFVYAGAPLSFCDMLLATAPHTSCRLAGCAR